MVGLDDGTKDKIHSCLRFVYFSFTSFPAFWDYCHLSLRTRGRIMFGFNSLGRCPVSINELDGWILYSIYRIPESLNIIVLLHTI